MTEDTMTLLSDHPFFKGIHEWYLEQIARYAREDKFERGEYLFHEGEGADSFFLIRKGTVQVGVTGPKGQFRPVQTLGADEIIGWSWMMPPHRWHFDAVACEPAKVIVLDGRYLRVKAEEDPVLGYELLKRLTQHIIQRLVALRVQVLKS